MKNVKEEVFILPEKWCIKLNDTGIVGKYFDGRCITNCYEEYDKKKNGYLKNINDNDQNILGVGKPNASFYCYGQPSDYLEITLDQFREHVLGEIIFKEVIEPIEEDLTYLIDMFNKLEL